MGKNVPLMKDHFFPLLILTKIEGSSAINVGSTFYTLGTSTSTWTTRHISFFLITRIWENGIQMDTKHSSMGLGLVIIGIDFCKPWLASMVPVGILDCFNLLE